MELKRDVIDQEGNLMTLNFSSISLHLTSSSFLSYKKVVATLWTSASITACECRREEVPIEDRHSGQK